MEINKQTKAAIPIIPEGNAAILAEIHSAEELVKQKTRIINESREHMIKSHRGNLDNTCEICKGYTIDIQILASAINARRITEEKLKSQL